jgi:hypothetical protein
MAATYFPGQQFPLPKLRFNPSSLEASDENPRRGLKLYGPYDSQRLGKDKIIAAVVYPRGLENLVRVVKDGLSNGSGAFGGFQGLFRIPIHFVAEQEAGKECEEEIKRELRYLLSDQRPDIVVLLTSARNENLYSLAKAELLGNGVPSQVITAETLNIGNQIQWTLENIALQIYAKIGGTPWTVMSSSPEKELVVGVSRAMDRGKNLVVGFVTLFTYDGDYQLLYSLSPKPVEWTQLDSYRESLAGLIEDAYREYVDKQGQPTGLVIHLCKRPGRFREVAAIEQAMRTLENSIPYALLHVNDDTNYRLFDSSHSTYVPESGMTVGVYCTSALLFLDGRPPGSSETIRRRRGVPRLLEVSMDKRSTMDIDEFPRLVRQVFEFSRVNWRGFNAQAIPATLNYSHLVARLVAEVGADRWNDIAGAGALRDKAWFL